MHGTAAAGRCRTKTGTLTGVSNLSGYCFNRDGKTMVFSILMGGVGDLGLAHLEQDRIAARSPATEAAPARPASSRISVPISSALASFEPGLSPATTYRFSSRPS